MIKTNEHNVSFNDLTVDTAGLQALTHAGIKTATEIGVAAGDTMEIRKFIRTLKNRGENTLRILESARSLLEELESDEFE